MPLTLTLSGITDGQQIDAADVTTPFHEVKAFVDGLETSLNTESSTRATSIANILAGNTAFTQISVGTDTTLTIASDTVTVTRTRHLIDTEGSAASDELVTINGGVEGDLLILQSVDAARVVVVRHNVGNIHLFAGLDVSLTHPQQALILLWDGTRWCQMAAPATGLGLRTMRAATINNYPSVILPDNTIGSGSTPRLALMPDLVAGNRFEVRASANTILGNMVANPTVTGTLAIANQTDSTYASITSAAAAGSIAGWVTTTFNVVRRSHNPMFEAVIRTGSTIADMRMWIGLVSAAPTNVDDLAAGTQGVVFRYSTVAGDTGFRGVCDNGTNVTVSAQVGPNLLADTRYVLRLRVDDSAGRAFFSVNGGAEVEVTANLPAAATELGAVVYGITTIGAPRVILFSRAQVRYD